MANATDAFASKPLLYHEKYRRAAFPLSVLT